MPPVSTAILNQWLSQLQNTSHDQGIKYLRTYEEGVRYFSALGLYCNTLILNNIGSWKCINQDSNKIYRYCLHDEEHTFFISQQILDYIGFDLSQAIYLSQLNDHGWSFQELAQEIREGFPNIHRSSGIFIPLPANQHI